MDSKFFFDFNLLFFEYKPKCLKGNEDIFTSKTSVLESLSNIY